MPKTYEPIATTTLTSDTNTVTFSSISSSFTDLVLTGTGYNTVATHYNLRFNSDTGSNYSLILISGPGGTIENVRVANQTSLFTNYNTGWGTTDAQRGNLIINIPNYFNSTTFKTVLWRTNRPSSATEAYVGLWRSTSAITTITLTNNTGNMVAGTSWSLYGIKAA